MPTGPLPRSIFHLGLDLGLRRNPSALALIEEVTRATGEFDHVYRVPKIETVLILRDVRPIALQTPYAELPHLLERYLGRLPQGFPVRLAVDATGVGAPVVELFRLAGLPADLKPIVITGGESVSRLPHAVTVPRDALLQNLRIRLECRDFRIPEALSYLPALQDELSSLGVRDNHPDDLAFALALALWSARPTPTVGERAEILPGSPVGDNSRQRRMAQLLRRR